MAPILFDIATVKEKRQFNFTLGRSRTTDLWVEKASFTFAQLAGFLTQTPAIGQKDGRCYTPALFSGNARNLQQTTQIDVVVLDSDCGHSLEFIHAAVAAKGWRSVIHSTYSHMTQQTAIAAAAFRKWEAENKGRTIGQYMMEKKGFLPAVMQSAYIADEVGRDLLINHAPCPKFRIILPLFKSWLAEDYESQDLANAKWRERIGALAYSLGLHHDQSCVDTSRLYYFPRVKDAEAAANYVCQVLDGEDCDLWSLPDAVAIPPGEGAMASLFDNVNNNNVIPLTPRGNPLVVKYSYVSRETGEVFDLTAWAAKYASRFQMAKAIQTRAPDMVSPRRAGVKQHIYCARSGDHMTSGVEGTGTYVVNASDLPRANLPSITSGFVIHCSHNGCSGVDRLAHVQTLLEQGRLSVADLTDPEFLTADLTSGVDISNIENIVKHRSEIVELEKTKTQAQYEKDTSNIHPSFYQDLPGALGEIHKYMVATAPKPQPALALGAALALCASAIGQRVKLQHFNTRPNIYILAIGVSGSGKDRPMKATKQIARAAGLFSELIGVEEITSDTGIINAIVNAPRQVMLIDEISFLLNAVSDPRAGAHLKGVVGTFLKLYSSADSTYKGKSFADTQKVVTIDQPCVSFYGSSTPRGLSDTLTSKDIESGLLSRMMVFDAGLHDPRIRAPENLPVPESVIEWLNAWNAVRPVPNIATTFGGDPVIAPRVVMLTEEAYKIAMDFEGEMHIAKGKARKRGKDALFVRAFENALKFALIRACAIWPVANEAGNGIMVDESALKVDAQTMRWAVDLSRATVNRMDSTTDDIADSPYEQALRALRKTIHRAGERGMTDRDLARSSAGRMPSKTLAEHLATLSEAWEIKSFNIKPTGRGRPRTAFVHKAFFAAHGVTELPDEDAEEEMAGE